MTNIKKKDGRKEKKEKAASRYENTNRLNVKRSIKAAQGMVQLNKETMNWLKVKESPITKNGVARVHSNVLKQLGLTQGKNIAISCGNGSILVHVYADTLIEEDMISLRPGDRRKLGVKYGNKVFIKPYSGVKKIN